MSKFTLGQCQFPTLGLRSQQPKNCFGPTLSCYLGLNISALILIISGVRYFDFKIRICNIL